MISYAAIAAALSSTAIRVLAYLFFRWVATLKYPPVDYSPANMSSIDTGTPTPSHHLHDSSNLHPLVFLGPNPQKTSCRSEDGSSGQ